MSTLIDLSGERFGKLLVLEKYCQNKKTQPQWICRCDCGSTVVVLGTNLRRDFTKSCGCLQRQGIRERQTKHGMDGTRTYASWCAMKTRCTNPNHKWYKYYGGRGIKICDRWMNSFTSFFEDMGERPDGMSLDRYPNNNGNYEPDNCRWATASEQLKNRRTL